MAEKESLLFLKKKKQKDFYIMAEVTSVFSCAHDAGITKLRFDIAENKSLFASFSSEKEDASFLP